MRIKKVSLILLIMLLSVICLNIQFSNVSEGVFENLMNEPVTIQIHKAITRNSQTVPDAPSSFTWIVLPGSVNLNWAAPKSDGGANITGYNVYRATTSGGPYTLLNTTTICYYHDSTVAKANNMTYYYVVTAVNSVGESNYSQELRITTPTIPSAPRSLQATISEYAITLSWTEPSSDGGISITGYNVYRATTSGGPYSWKAWNWQSLSFTDEDVTNDSTYCYVVTAVNKIGESAYSNEICASLTTKTTDTSPGFGLIVIMGVIIGISITRRRK